MGSPGKLSIEYNFDVFAFNDKLQFLSIQADATVFVPLIASRDEYDLSLLSIDPSSHTSFLLFLGSLSDCH